MSVGNAFILVLKGKDEGRGTQKNAGVDHDLL